MSSYQLAVAFLVSLGLSSPLTPQVQSQQRLSNAAQPTHKVAEHVTQRLTPLHRYAGETRYWAAGHDYKACFDADGRSTFFPRLGRRFEHNLPWAYRVVEVRRGRHKLPVTQARMRLVSASKIAFDRRGFEEHYEVRSKGLEQSFVIPRPIAGSGDLVVAGSVDSELGALPAKAAQQTLAFSTAEGEEILEYGSAVAFDARGRSSVVATSYANGRIELHVPEAFVESATYPLLIDPIIKTTMIIRGVWGTHGESEAMTVDAKDGNRRMLVAYRHFSSSTDPDAYVVMRNLSGNIQGAVWHDLRAGQAPSALRLIDIPHARRWLVAYGDTTISTGVSSLVAQVFDYDAAAPKQRLALAAPKGFRVSTVTGSGRRSGAKTVMLACELAQGTKVYEARGTLFDIGFLLAGTWFALGDGAAHAGLFRGVPSMPAAVAASNDPFVVAWQEKVGSAAWKIRAAQFDDRGKRLAINDPPLASSGFQSHSPRIDGIAGRFLISATLGKDPKTPWGTSIDAVSVDWPRGAAMRVRKRQRYANSPGAELINGSVAIDPRTKSHWLVAWRDGKRNSPFINMLRTGPTGDVYERMPLDWRKHGNPSATPRAKFDYLGGLWRVAFIRWKFGGTDVFVADVTGARDAVIQQYGSTCGGSIASDPPYKGSEFYGLELAASAPQKPCLLLLGIRPSSIDLSGAGLRGCFLHVDPGPGFIAVAAGLSSVAGKARLQFPLPELAVDLYAQWLHVEPKKLRLATTKGLAVRVR